MTREELLKSKEYWIGEIQLTLFELISDFLEKNKISRVQFAEKMGVSKGYVSQILNGDFDHRISKLVELSMSIGKVPRVDFQDIEKIIKLDELGELHSKRYESINIELKFEMNMGISLSSKDSTMSIKNNQNTTNYYNYEKSKTKQGIDEVA